MTCTTSIAGLAVLGAALLGCSGGEAGSANASFPALAYQTVTSDGTSLSIEVRTSPDQPPIRGLISVEYRIHDAAGKPQPGLAFSVLPWMPAMGHGASITPEISDEGGGRYVISNVEVFMPGQWELRTTIDGPPEERATPAIDVQ